jgi:hypothetical protein
MALVLENVTYNGHNYVRAQCSCGNTFHAANEDFAKGDVVSCGHKFAGNLLERLDSIRFPKGDSK